jgi:hypothetical protein
MKKAIVENQKVINIIEYMGGRLHLPQGQLMVDCGRYPVAIGDDCVDGRFYRDGASLAPEPTEAERLEALNADLIQTQLALAELAGIVAGGEL